MFLVDNKGFTLIELLAVLVILSVIAVVAVPTISTSLDKQKNKKVENAKQEILSKSEIKIDKILEALGTKKDSFNSGECYVTALWLKDNGIITGSQYNDLNGETLYVYYKIKVDGDNGFNRQLLNDVDNKPDTEC